MKTLKFAPIRTNLLKMFRNEEIIDDIEDITNAFPIAEQDPQSKQHNSLFLILLL